MLESLEIGRRTGDYTFPYVFPNNDPINGTSRTFNTRQSKFRPDRMVIFLKGLSIGLPINQSLLKEIIKSPRVSLVPLPLRITLNGLVYIRFPKYE